MVEPSSTEARREGEPPVGELLRAGFTGVDHRQTVHDRVYETLRRSIIGGVLQGGARLVQSEIAEALGVSTTPVREALRNLASEGLIHFDSYRGALVREPSLDDIREIYRLRLILEPIAIRETVETLSSSQLARAQALWQQMEEETDAGRWVDLNVAFHASLEPESSPRLKAILKQLRESAAAIVGLSFRSQPQLMPDGNRDHRELLDAVVARDADAAAAIVTRHFEATLRAVESYYEQGGANGPA